ncbi:MAG: response regulator [Deltaproteobacteria bacterium]|jgi:signal transduction histidine kinase/CheY-like chemotaxis protein|nr:response regulator [Deltaproteobacteria bacterium]
MTARGGAESRPAFSLNFRDSWGRAKALAKRNTLSILAVFTAAAVLVVSLYTGSLVTAYLDSDLTTFASDLQSAAAEAAALASGDEFAALAGSGEAAAQGYQRLKSLLAGLQTGGMRVCYVRLQDGSAKVVADSGAGGPAGVPQRPGDDFDVSSRKGLSEAFEGIFPRAEPVRLSARADLFAAYAPVFDSSGAVTAVAAAEAVWGGRDQAWGAGMRSISLVQIAALLVFLASGFASLLGWRREAALADAANCSKSMLLAGMSHEIRTPMNAIIGLSELARRDYGKLRALEHLEGIKTAGAGLLSVVNDILEFSRLEAGEPVREGKPYGTARLIIGTVAVARAGLGAAPLKLLVDARPDLPETLVGDQGRVRRVIFNLLGQAFRNARGGFVRFTVERETEGYDLRLVMTAEVPGAGLKEGDIDRLFGGFNPSRDGPPVDPALACGPGGRSLRHTDGAGLGLALAAQICRALGGSLTVRPGASGSGAVFRAELVQKVASWKPVGQLFEASSASAGGSFKAGFYAPDAKVLVACGTERGVQELAALLAPYRITPDVALSGEEALERIAARDYDLVLVDQVMPGLGGVGVCRRVRCAVGGRFECLPVVALAQPHAEDEADVLTSAGFSGALAKPVDPADLDEALNRWIPDSKIFSRLDGPQERRRSAWPGGIGRHRSGLPDLPSLNRPLAGPVGFDEEAWARSVSVSEELKRVGRSGACWTSVPHPGARAPVNSPGAFPAVHLASGGRPADTNDAAASGLSSGAAAQGASPAEKASAEGGSAPAEEGAPGGGSARADGARHAGDPFPVFLEGVDREIGLSLAGGSERRYLSHLQVFSSASRGVLERLYQEPCHDPALKPLGPPADMAGRGIGPVFRVISETRKQEAVESLSPPAADGAPAQFAQFGDGGLPGQGGGESPPQPSGPQPFTNSEFVFVARTLKSCLAGIGAEALSFEAMLLERAGRAGDAPYLARNLPAFREGLSRLILGVESASLGEPSGTEASPGEHGDHAASEGAAVHGPSGLLRALAAPGDGRAAPAASDAAFSPLPPGRSGAAGRGASPVLFEELLRLEAALGSRDMDAVDAAVPQILARCWSEGVRREAERISRGAGGGAGGSPEGEARRPPLSGAGGKDA